MKQRDTLPEKEAEKIIWHIFQAQNDLNRLKIIHRDLKPDNVGVHFEGLNSQQVQ